MNASIRGYEKALNETKLDIKRIFGSFECQFHKHHEVEFFTVAYTSPNGKTFTRVVFCNQPTLGQYLVVMAILKPVNGFVLCANIDKLTMWSEK